MPAVGRNPRVTEETLLLDYAQRVERFRAGRRAVHIHLSRLQPFNRRPHHINIAAETIESVVHGADMQLFRLSNGDIVVACKGNAVAGMEKAVLRLQYLFSDDPLVCGSRNEPSLDFATWFDLEQGYPAFLAHAERLHAGRQAALQKSFVAPKKTPPVERPPLDPHRLGDLVDAIKRADLSNVLRRQAVCAIVGNSEPQAIYSEVYISIDDLRHVVMPEVNILGDRWLFQYLTHTLDRRMLKLLATSDDSSIGASISLNLNVATLLSPEFLAFDKNLRVGARGTIVIELQTIDIFADLGAYVFARGLLKERGYRICLDGLTVLTLPYVNRETLEADLVKVMWRPDLLKPGSEQTARFRAQIESIGKARTILCHCDSAEAVAFGQSIGINLFQGRHVDRLLNANQADGIVRLRAPR